MTLVPTAAVAMAGLTATETSVAFVCVSPPAPASPVAPAAAPAPPLEPAVPAAPLAPAVAGEPASPIDVEPAALVPVPPDNPVALPHALSVSSSKKNKAERVAHERVRFIHVSIRATSSKT